MAPPLTASLPNPVSPLPAFAGEQFTLADLLQPVFPSSIKKAQPSSPLPFGTLCCPQFFVKLILALSYLAPSFFSASFFP